MESINTARRTEDIALTARVIHLRPEDGKPA